VNAGDIELRSKMQLLLFVVERFAGDFLARRIDASQVYSSGAG
jgi:hypothetical protein